MPARCKRGPFCVGDSASFIEVHNGACAMTIRLRPRPFTWLVGAMLIWCGVLGWIGLHARITNSDPAGTGIGSGIVQGYAAIGLFAAFVLGAFYFTIRWDVVRYVSALLLLALSVSMIVFIR